MITKPLILIVEDDETIGNFITAVLVANKFDVIKAKNGKEAIEMSTSHVPELILLDLGLPDMDGTDVLKQIRSWSKIPIIVVSARSHEREKVESLDLGADDYITKPFGTSELLARIRNAIKHSIENTASNYLDLEKITIGNLEINYEKRLVLLDGNKIRVCQINCVSYLGLSNKLCKLFF